MLRGFMAKTRKYAKRKVLEYNIGISFGPPKAKNWRHYIAD